MTIRLRPAVAGDAPLVADHRDAMFAEAGLPAAAVAAAGGPYRAWLAAALADASYLGWIADVDGSVAGSIGLWLLPWPCHPKHPTTSVRGYVSNMWVVPPHRRKGIGRLLMAEATEGAKARGVTWMALHATEQGRALYASLGWQAGNEMVLKLG